MARARNIKPSLFKNEVLGIADPFLTLLFESLWCLADKRGRLEDRPLRIKAETFPYREGLDINRYLTDLTQLGFIRRYVINGVAVIQVLNFEKHQNPHHTERESELPEYSEESDTYNLTVNEPLNNGLTPSDSLNLIPDNPSNTSSGKPDTKTDSLDLLKHLNQKANRNFKDVSANLSIIAARLKEFSKDELIAMVDDRCKAWATDEKMVEYLRPATLFNATKCAGYVGNLGALTVTNHGKPWYITATGIEDKGKELGIELLKDEVFPDFKVRVYRKAGITPDMVRAALQDFEGKQNAR